MLRKKETMGELTNKPQRVDNVSVIFLEKCVRVGADENKSVEVGIGK